MAQTPTVTASSSPHQNSSLSHFPPTSLDASTPGGLSANWASGGLGVDEPDSSSTALHPTYALLSAPTTHPTESSQFFHKFPDHQMTTSTPANGNNYFVAMDASGGYYSPQQPSSSSAFNQLPPPAEESTQLTDLDSATKGPSRSTGGVSLPGFTSPESAFYQYQNRMEGQLCQICGELAAGFHHGAYVCEACKVSAENKSPWIVY